MSDKFQNKYRIQSARLQNWDYGWSGSYFVTICTRNREHFFGEIINGEMALSEIGKLVQQEWKKTPQIRLDMHLKIGAFVIMPNHFHAIIFIGENRYNADGDDGGCRDAMHRVSTMVAPDQAIDDYKNVFSPQSKNLASILRGFKSAVCSSARRLNPDFAWQPRFHDHIIRNENSLNCISDYIMKNPAQCTEDKFFS